MELTDEQRALLKEVAEYFSERSEAIIAEGSDDVQIKLQGLFNVCQQMVWDILTNEVVTDETT